MTIDSQQLEVEPVDARIVAVEQCLREQYETMQKQLEALAKPMWNLHGRKRP